MSDIKSWLTTAASNNSPAPDGFPEGMAPSDVNNAAREVMAAVRKHYDEFEWRDWGYTIAYGSATTFTTAVGDGDTTAIYHAARRVRAVGTLTGTIYGTIASSAHTTQTTVTVTWDSGSLNNEALTITVGISAANESIPQASIGNQNVIIPSTTAMLFYENAAPVGWTIVAAVDEHSVRLTKGSVAGGQTGGAIGGTNNFSTQFDLQAEGDALGPGNHVLLVAELPAHNHSGTASTTNSSHTHNIYDYTTGSGSLGSVDVILTTGTRTARAGVIPSSGTHTHTLSVNNTGSGTAHNHSIDMRVKWAACIVATRD